MTDFPKELFQALHVMMRANIFPPLPTINTKMLMTHLSCSFPSVGRGHVQPSQTTECRLHRGSEGRRVWLLHLQRCGFDPYGRPKPVPLLRPAETLCHRHGQVWLQVSGKNAPRRDDWLPSKRQVILLVFAYDLVFKLTNLDSSDNSVYSSIQVKYEELCVLHRVE